MPTKPRHLLMIAPVDNLDCCSRIVHMANAFCEAGTKVSLICHPQRGDNAQELKQLLHKSATVYYALVNDQKILHVRHVSGADDRDPEAEFFDLTDFIDDAAKSVPKNRNSIRQLTYKRRLEHLGRKFPFIARWLPQVTVNPKLALHTPPHLYQKYKKIMALGWYGPNPFYFYMQALIINSKIEPIDAIHCHDLWTLPVGCLVKELFNIPLLYDSHEIGTTFVADADDREVAIENEKWMYELCDSFSTVSDPCADYYKKICPSLNPLVLMNAHRLLWQKPVGLTSIKERLSLSPDTPVAVYVGALGTFYSHLDRFIEAITLSRSNLHLAIVGDRGEIGLLSALSRRLDLFDKRVFFLGRVNYDKVFDTIYGADFGIIPNVQDTVNPVWSILSSKLFDYAQVEIPIVSDWAPEIEKVFDRFAIGQTVDFQKEAGDIAELLDGFYARVVSGDFPMDERKQARESFVWPENVVDLVLSGKSWHDSQSAMAVLSTANEL